MNNVSNLVKMNISNMKSLKNVMALSIIIFTGVSIVNPLFLTMLIGLLVFNLGYQVLAYEDSQGIDYLVSYMPVTRKDFVLSRYMFGLVVLLISIIAYSVCYAIALNFNPVDIMIIDYKISLAMGIFTAVLGYSIIVPCIFKVGIVKGRIISSVFLMGTVMASSFIMHDLNQKIGMNIIFDRLARFHPILTLLVGSVVVMGISYFISLKIYNKKEIE